jgi:adenylosuccinate lyase
LAQRSDAHEVVYEVVRAAATNGMTFAAALSADSRVAAHLDATAIAELLDPSTQVGLSAQLARAGAERADQLSIELGYLQPPSPTS